MSDSPSTLASTPAKDEPLALTVHELPAAGQAVAGQRANGRLKMLLVVLVCAAPVLASYFTYFVIKPSGTGTAYSALIEPAPAMPALATLTLDGQTRPLRSLIGQWLLVVVDDAACGTACEKRLFMQRQLRDMEGRERDRIDKLWLVLDDAPVSPALQAALLASPGMNILRLPREKVATWLKPAPGQALHDHLYIVDPLGAWMMRAPADADPMRVKRDLGRLLKASAGWDKPGHQRPIDELAAPATPGTPAPAASRP